jgi:hypothetical protein
MADRTPAAIPCRLMQIHFPDTTLYKRGKIWWYKFTWNGEAIRESTKQTNSGSPTGGDYPQNLVGKR